MIHFFSMAPLARPGLVVSGEWLICPAVRVCRPATTLTTCYFVFQRQPESTYSSGSSTSLCLSRTVRLIDRPSGDLIVLNYTSSCITVQFRLFLFASLSWNPAIWITSWRPKRMTTRLSDSKCLPGNFAIRLSELASLSACSCQYSCSVPTGAAAPGTGRLVPSHKMRWRLT